VSRATPILPVHKGFEMDFDYSARTLELANRLGAFMREEVAPRDAEWRASAQKGTFPLVPVDDLKRRARALGLWNLFLPSLREDQPGTRLTNLEYAPLAEMTGRIPWSPEVFNCNSPDSGNMEILQLCATPEQRERWLNPLLDGAIRSCFSMSEPATASSDPTNLQTTIRRDGDHYHVRGRKWFSTGARHPNCRFSIVMGHTYSDEAGETHKRYSMIIVPFETPGLNIIRDVSIMNHHSPEGHLRDRFRRPCARCKSSWTGRRRFHHCPGAARAGPHTSLYENDRPVRACIGNDGRAREEAHRIRFCARRIREHSGLDRGVSHRDRSGSAPCVAGRLAHGQGGQQSGEG
jgi:Acyl-CoA dehydrogenase, N-terminal domain/Acyl-CoA dehydrogenase, middle domain